MSDSRIYLDTSIYFEALCRPPFLAELKKILAGNQACSSILLLIEVERNLLRMIRQNEMSVQEYQKALDYLRTDLAHLLLKELTQEMTLTGNFPPVLIPRSNDLVHLRTAIWFQRNGGLNGFLTLDKSQRMSAVDLGLPVISL